jgi:hypothetical protein
VYQDVYNTKFEYSLTPWSSALLEKLEVDQLVQEPCASYVIRRFIAALKKQPATWAESYKSSLHSHTMFFKIHFNIILPLRVGPSSRLFSWGFWTKIVCAFLTMYATCSSGLFVICLKVRMYDEACELHSCKSVIEQVKTGRAIREPEQAVVLFLPDRPLCCLHMPSAWRVHQELAAFACLEQPNGINEVETTLRADYIRGILYRTLSENVKIKMYRTVILPLFCMSEKLGL